ncbi:lytic transglycosylase domain-containing protein [Microbacterium marinilacus]|uniref:Transglycosylase SLT domain-containing protein n=1 Tax=Microbacterium marinilacus TaxID=415209 RepID=A0ABP7BLS9_9MICO|nr:lytic murein transglycosylase [Microbacterium marinilacus]MBY0687667.1 lytic murein transglycosylase [Microbacterium marinilacus]
MTEPTPPHGSAGDFDALLRRSPDEPAVPEPRRRTRRWVLPTLTAALATLGIGALAAAALSPSQNSTTPDPTASAAATDTTPSPQPVPTVGAAVDEATDADASRDISALADTAWVSRIATEADIPERALAAYAGAALDTARTDPGCGLGWNTLAAIGHVESEHGTIDGSRIGGDGIAAPAIVGIPLDGQDTDEIPDTDGGELDGDATWDRAVGPMQFIPETWARYAQDGNDDGTADVHQIDDAALTAAVYLCAVGGDLTQPENWIAAIDAYNPSVDYNNRVAAAASHYATLR